MRFWISSYDLTYFSPLEIWIARVSMFLSIYWDDSCSVRRRLCCSSFYRSSRYFGTLYLFSSVHFVIYTLPLFNWLDTISIGRSTTFKLDYWSTNNSLVLWVGVSTYYLVPVFTPIILATMYDSLSLLDSLLYLTKQPLTRSSNFLLSKKSMSRLRVKVICLMSYPSSTADMLSCYLLSESLSGLLFCNCSLISPG